MTNKIFTEFCRDKSNPLLQQKDGWEKASEVLLTPIRTVFGHTRVRSDIKSSVIAKTIHKIAMAILSVFTLPLTGLATLLGIGSLHISKTHKTKYKEFFKSTPPSPPPREPTPPPPPRISTPPPSPREPIVPENSDDIEGKFWEEYFDKDNKDLRGFFKLVMAQPESECDSQQKADFIVDHYVEYRKQFDSSFVVDKSTKDVLESSVLKNLTAHYQVSGDDGQADNGVPFVGVTDGQTTLRRYRTNGNGSCGFHALIGVAQNGEYSCDAGPIRQNFCNWIRGQNQLPEQINRVLTDYFCHYNVAPGGFKTAEVNQIYNQLRAGYDQLTVDVKDQRINQFVNNPLVQNAYLVNMSNVVLYILQDELEAAAIRFGITVDLYQPGWGNDPTIGHEVLNDGQANRVSIWYNGVNHYERAERLDN